jgi:SmpA / OmlA family
MRQLVLLWICLAASLAGCDQQRSAKLEPGVATEAEVRREFGEPALIVEKADGTKLLEYPRQPEGSTNYLAVIGADGKLTALTQLLTPENFAQVQPGMAQNAVRRLLGKPAKTQRFDLKPGEEHWQWRFQEPGGHRKVFTVTFGADSRVVSTAIADDTRDTQPGG